MSQGDKKNWDTRRSPQSVPSGPEGWATYRSWLGRVAPARSRRVMSDSSVYTLQGYKDWAAQVRKDWDNDS